MDSKKYIIYVEKPKVSVLRARAVLKSCCGRNIEYGYVDFEDTGSVTKISCHIKNLLTDKNNRTHAIHIHEKGNLAQFDDKDCCSSLGGHYNPFNKDHGGRLTSLSGITVVNYNRHVGDLGNIVVDETGECHITFEDPLITLRGSYSVIDRSVIIHEDEDDLGKGGHSDSLTTGHAGKRIAYGKIVLSS